MKVNTHIQKLAYPEYASLSSKSARVDLAQHKSRYQEHVYTLSQDKDLIKKIAQMENVEEENILITAGADGALHHIAETFLDEGKVAVIPLPAFGRFEFHTKITGAKPIFVKHKKFPHSFDLKIITKIAQNKKAELIFLANPNNPTGELIRKKHLKNFIQDNPSRLIAIDEVLVEDMRDSACELVNIYKNLIVIKSFSKLFEIPGLRVGYIVTNPQLRNLIGKNVSPYEISSLSLNFLKRLVFINTDLDKRKRELRQARDLLRKEISLSLSNTDASVALIKAEKGNSLFEYLLKHGILAVDGKMFRGLEKTNTVRVVINNVSDIKKLIRIIKKYNK